MDERFSRTEMVLGAKALEKLKMSRVALFGVGGVGGYAAEVLARSGVGEIDLIDNDIVSISNINRQIIALSSTVGRYKTEVMKERLLDINPQMKVNVHNIFYLPEEKGRFDFSAYDYIIDAIDTVSGKIGLVLEAHDAGVPIISSMGTGNKINPVGFKVSDIYETKTCPLARVMRRELKKRNIKKLKVVYSEEEPREVEKITDGRKVVPGSVAFVPPVSGIIMASEVILDLIKD